LRDFAVVAAIMRGRQAHPQVSLDINPTSQQVLADLTKTTTDLIELSLLGASDDEIVHDFALTELATDRLIADWKTANRNRELRWPGYG
jgi:hypothetical protein